MSAPRWRRAQVAACGRTGHPSSGPRRLLTLPHSLLPPRNCPADDWQCQGNPSRQGSRVPGRGWGTQGMRGPSRPRAGPRSARVRFARHPEPREGLSQAELALPGLRNLGAPGRTGLGERALSELSWQAWHSASFAGPGSAHVMSTETEPPSWQVSRGAVEGSQRQGDPCLPYGGIEVAPWPGPFRGSF